MLNSHFGRFGEKISQLSLCIQTLRLLLVHVALPLQVLLVDEMEWDPFYSSPGVIVLFPVHLPKTALCKRAGGVRHEGHGVKTVK